MDPSRRALLCRLVGLAAATLGLPGCRDRSAPGPGVPVGPAPAPAAAPAGAGSPAGGGASPATIPAELDAVLEAACARLLPSSAGPGAREAGVIEYCRRALGLPYYRRLRVRILAGARRLDAVAGRDWGVGFAGLPADAQDRVLSYVESGAEDRPGFTGGAFVHELLALSLEGFLGDPVHGGNRGEVGWGLLGYQPGAPRPGECPGPCK